MNQYLIHYSEKDGTDESFVIIEAADAGAAQTQAVNDARPGWEVYGVFELYLVKGSESLPVGRDFVKRRY